MYAHLIGTGSSVPERVLTNADLEKMVDTDSEWIETRAGIKERRITSDDEWVSDLATEAARKALEHAGMSPKELDLIICATVTGDTTMPSAASIVQYNIGAGGATYDLGSACPGFLYGLATAKAYIESGMFRNIMVIGAETTSKVVDFTDRNTCILFGDGAGAVVITATEEEGGIMEVEMESDGALGHLLYLPGMRQRIPVLREKDPVPLYVKMQGNDLFKYAVKSMADSSVKVLEKGGLGIDDIKYLIPHQANIRIIEATAKRAGVPLEKVLINIEKFGNTSSATIPIAFDEAVRDGRIQKGDALVGVSFGAGLSWGAVLFKWY
ncbi:MAG: beta-ketoacyl-ACP synthase III [candidate division Zixibacteria bacterium]|nr:beta-ketoacyl-ACP synthase III [candidate division Zixibacteria bacterium]